MDRATVASSSYVGYSRHMETKSVIAAFAALAQPTRLEVFRVLVRHEPLGLAAGVIAAELGLRHNTLSTHLGIMAHAGLVRSERQSRSIIYRASLDTLRAVIKFLVQDCCAGRDEICGSLIAELTACDTSGPTQTSSCVAAPPVLSS